MLRIMKAPNHANEILDDASPVAGRCWTARPGDRGDCRPDYYWQFSFAAARQATQDAAGQRTPSPDRSQCFVTGFNARGTAVCPAGPQGCGSRCGPGFCRRAARCGKESALSAQASELPSASILLREIPLSRTGIPTGVQMHPQDACRRDHYGWQSLGYGTTR